MVELVFILDRGGSMCALEQDTIGGFNAMIEKQKKEGKEVEDNEVEDNDRSNFGRYHWESI